jgi:murein DD-endopeptidase MepM/ murein hydrolase activator NlpD
VARGFEPPAETWAAGHRGVDLRATVGQPVRAALAGRIEFVGRIAGVAVVVVSHGRTRTTYQPVVATVDPGVEVAVGAVIGRVEWLGSHCLPASCLHWGLLDGDRYLDPLSLVGGGPRPVRLLPLDGNGWLGTSSFAWSAGPTLDRLPRVKPGPRWGQRAVLPAGRGLPRFGLSVP